MHFIYLFIVDKFIISVFINKGVPCCGTQIAQYSEEHLFGMFAKKECGPFLSLRRFSTFLFIYYFSSVEDS